MVKGTKRKIPMEKIEKREYLATCFSKRSSGLYSKASQLCLLSGSQIAILATPPSSHSNVSFYSFGHSSVDSVVSAFLSGERPVPVSAPVPSENKQMREEFWWDDERLYTSENLEELNDALESMSSILSQLRSMIDHHQDLKKKNETEKINVDSNHETQLLDQTLKNQKNETEKINVDSNHETQLLDQTLNPQPISAICCGPDDDSLKTGTEIVVLGDDSTSENFKGSNGEEQDQFLKNDNDFPEEGMSFDEFFKLLDFETTFEGLPADGFSENDHIA